MKTIVYNNISDFHKQSNLPEPENPLFSVVHKEMTENEVENCNDDLNEPISLVCDFYSISLKNIISGELIYGRTKYDSTKGTLLFTAPNQSMIFKGLVFSNESYHIAFHKDYVRNHGIYEKIKNYSFFNYHVNEALHLTPKEEQIIKDVFKNIEIEYHNNQDEFSKEIILSQLDTLLKYADRLYKRQFLNRAEINKRLITRFKEILNNYFENERLVKDGIPTVEWMATKLKVSHRYMSDTIKAETGKTAIDQINLFLIEEAKNMLLNPNNSISDTAYQLGFEYPQYFSKLFKRKVGISPKKYIEQAQMN